MALFGSEAAAQSEDERGGFLVDFLEDNLSGENRAVTVTGLEGALSSQASVEKITVADDDGVWLTIEEAQLDWNRLALLQGELSVNQLTAQRIVVSRTPQSPPGAADLPAPEATPFQLPDLPVSVQIGTLAVAELTLEKPVLGTAADFRLNGNLALADGALNSALSISRLDGRDDELRLNAQFSNATRELALDLALHEGPGGVLSAALDLPGQPAIDLQVKGSGPTTDFVADLGLKTDGIDRLAGQLTLAAVASGTEPVAENAAAETQPIAFSADLAGDITALLQPEFQPFFGPNTEARLRGQSDGDGGFRLDQLSLQTNALTVTGSLQTSDGGVIDAAKLDANITPPNGAATVTLPIAGGATTLGALTIEAQKPQGQDWRIVAQAQEITTADLSLRQADLRMSGTVLQSNGFELDGLIEAEVEGLAPNDPALAQSLGTAIAVSSRITTMGPEALRLDALDMQGNGYRLRGDVFVDALTTDARIGGDLRAELADLSQLSALTGQQLGGRVSADLAGAFAPLSGAFDVDLSVLGQDVSAGIATVDDLLDGTTTITLRADRSEAGVQIDQFKLDSAGLFAAAKGDLNSTNGKLHMEATLKDLGAFLPQVPGALSLEADLTRQEQTIAGTASLRGPNASAVNLQGNVDLDGDSDLTFDASINALERFVPTLKGAVAAGGSATRRAGSWTFDSNATGPAGFVAKLDGTVQEDQGDATIQFDAALAELERLVPELVGRLTATGQAERRAGIWQIDSRADGPSGVASTVQGSWNEQSGEADIAAKGQLRLEGVNPFIAPNLLRGAASFDLALKGPLGLDALSGDIRSTGATLALPTAALRLDDIATSLLIRDAQVTLQLSARPSDGGSLRVSGPIRLTAPFDSDLRIGLTDVVLTDKLSYDSRLSGALQFAGGLIGENRLAGRIDVAETNINLATAGGSVTAAPIPDIRHTGDDAATRTTRKNAGLLDQENGSDSGDGGGRTQLDVVINAPNRINARGRGVRAELGGQVHLRGSTADLAPAGQISLIRGTFDILGRRLVLDEGQITLQGDLRPFLMLRSTASTAQGTATLEVSGLIDSPQIQVTSDPDRPSEEALALLLFGENIQDLSPLALARLAASVARLSGRGGGGFVEDAVRDGTGASNVELGLDQLGAGLLDIGGYISDNVYTDLNVNTRGDSELSINLDVSNSLTVTGTVDGQGETGLGLFFKRDY
ncbi:translocation/assembly module TamB domain-containing protein [Phaeobacter sp.]|uniref:translocation/assembly module TamB domain-containing protein n=1 Tax=Phaeobacter sp. TaxID=1902409 RepID=UPI0025E843C9|nr:translocation/assembly module TamB domain-containing protein [Phaeobacter sp.]